MKKRFLLFIFSIAFCISYFVQAQNSELWSMTSSGGANNKGCIFKIKPDGTGYARPFDFDSVSGKSPYGSLIQAFNGKLYGMTLQGGSNNLGVIFSFDASTNTFSKLLDFNGAANGRMPSGSLTQASNGKLYGMTQYGGSAASGVLFSFDPSFNTYTKLLDFSVFNSTNGALPFSGLIQASNGKLYGMTWRGGSVNSDYGIIFSYDPINNIYNKLFNFDGINGYNPYGNLVQATDGKLYGMTQQGGNNGNGVLFSFDPSSNTFYKLLDFIYGVNGNGSSPQGSLIQASNGKLYGMTTSGGSNYDGVLFSFDPTTNTYNKILDFNGTNGNGPNGSLIQALNGKLYGMTDGGGNNGKGVLFSFDPASNLYVKLRDLNLPDGITPRYSSFLEVAFAINTNGISSPLCRGSSISVPFNVVGTYNTANTFTAQLSNSSGSFVSPTNIGTLTSVSSGTIIATIPSNAITGTGYRIRVVSSDPVVIGNDNGSNITINPLPVLNLKLFIQGYYSTGGTMQQVLYNQGVDGNFSSTHVDTVLVELHPAANTAMVTASYNGVLQTNGTLACTFPCSVVSNSYYIAIKHRTAIQTWSAAPIAFSQTTSYDFTTAQSKAYGGNMTQAETGKWAFYIADMNQDENVDLLDYPILDYDIWNGFSGYYVSDLNGDGNVDLLDFPIYQNNLFFGSYSHHP